MRDRIVFVHGAPFFGPSPLEIFVRPLIARLGIEMQSVERAEPVNAAVFSDADRVYGITHSHGSDWFRLALNRIGGWWPVENLIGWSSCDGVRMVAGDFDDPPVPSYAPQTMNLPFTVPACVNICRAYHRHLPMPRDTVGIMKIAECIADFPINSLFQPSVNDQDVTDTEIAGTVSDALALLGQAVEGPLGALIGSVLGSQIDHSLVCAAAAGSILRSVKEFFGVLG